MALNRYGIADKLKDVILTNRKNIWVDHPWGFGNGVSGMGLHVVRVG
jgi:hypothetical protein